MKTFVFDEVGGNGTLIISEQSCDEIMTRTRKQLR